MTDEVNYISSNNYCKSDGKRFDVLKIVLSIFIVAIHTVPPSIPVLPIFRLAVPIFFVLSSYLFFSKQVRLSSEEEKTDALRRFVGRYLKLYLFWFILLLPITVIVRKWYVSPGFDTVLSVFQCFLFSSTFRASWFLMATLIAIVSIWFFSKWINEKWLVLLGIVFYLFCCLTSNYYSLLETSAMMIEAYEKYKAILFVPYNSFPVAFLFVMCGKILAERSVYIPQHSLFVLLIASLLLLCGEYFLIKKYGLSIADDSYLFLIPSSIFAFMFIGQSQWTFKTDTMEMRKASTIIYCCHASYASIVNSFLGRCGMASQHLYYVIWFVITLLLSFLTVIIILRLEKYPFLRFLKYSH